jgi:cellulose synthase/poly-beta-1,6-N-acetylglucosamine synthase-like glycosyltransferase
MSRAKKVQSSFSFISVLFIILIFFVFYLYSSESAWNVPAGMNWMVQFMLYYLCFICVRTITLIGLSFYEYLNSSTLPELVNHPLVTIIIPCYNEEIVIADSIRSVENIDYPNLEILVVDDGSTDNTFENALGAAKNRKIRVITKENGGKADSLNLGIEQSLGDYVFCMDADSLLDPQVLNVSLPYFMRDSELGAIAGSVKIGNTHSILTRFQNLEYVIGLNFHKKAQSAMNVVSIVPGPVGLFKKSVLLEVGGYDPGTYAEDCDLTLKILMAGYHINYCPNMYAITEAPESFQQLCIQRYRWSRGTIQAIMKNFGQVFSRKSFSLRNLLILAYVAIETMIIPSVNFIFAMLTLVYALTFDNVNIYGPFFLGLILMDATIALYSILMEKEIVSLFFYSLISRLTFGFSLEVMRFYSMVDEILGLPMKWGQLKRKGMK